MIGKEQVFWEQMVSVEMVTNGWRKEGLWSRLIITKDVWRSLAKLH